MSEVLSQSEIDELLLALSSGSVSAEELKKEEHKKKVRVYDFRRPNKFSKEQLHTLRVIFENYSRLLNTYLSALMRTMVNTDVLSVEQVTYEEYTKSLPDPSIVNIFTIPPLEGNAILELNPVIAFTFIDRLFGGPGQPPEKIRVLTEIEQTVIERIVQRMLDMLREPWETVLNIAPHLEVIETNPQFAQIVSRSEMVVLISMECRINEHMGMINICLPYLTLEPVIDKLSVHYWFADTSREKTQENLANLKARLKQATLPITAILGSTTITVAELLDLQVGDVIPLNQPIKDNLEIKVGYRTKFLGHPGVIGQKMGIQIQAVVDQGDDISG